MNAAVVLTDEQLDALADRIADRLTQQAAGELIDAAELAKRIGRGRDYVYEHAAHLGAIRLGDGERPRLAFRWPQVLDRLDTTSPEPAAPAVRRPARRRTQPSAGLLPIRGDSAERTLRRNNSAKSTRNVRNAAGSTSGRQ